MNTIKTTPNALANSVENERTVRDRIVEYLHRVEIVSDSIALTLLQQTANALQKRVDTSSLSIIARNSKLNDILQHMQTSIVKLETKSSYSNAIRKKIKRTSFAMKIISKDAISSSERNRQIREFIVNVTDVVKKKIMKIMFTKNIMIKLQKDKKNIGNVIRLVNDFIKIQAEFEKIKKILQKKTEVIKRLVSSISIRARIYVVRVNDIKVDHINANNQKQTIAYLQQINTRLHSELVIKKVVWSTKTIREEKMYSTLHMKIESVATTNRLLIENLIENFEMKQCERFIKNCTMLQCMNCRIYEHMTKWCRILIVCEICAKKNRISECDSSITRQHKKCVASVMRKHVIWDSSCKMRMKKKNKTKKARAKRARLYIEEESKKTRSIVITEQNIDETQRVVSKSWTLVEIKKRKMKKVDISSIKKMTNKIIAFVLMRSSSNLVKNAFESSS